MYRLASELLVNPDAIMQVSTSIRDLLLIYLQFMIILIFRDAICYHSNVPVNDADSMATPEEK